jgi:hypothetical protein
VFELMNGTSFDLPGSLRKGDQRKPVQSADDKRVFEIF